jgi:ABC-type amino acid transport substrate-binding protein
VVIGVPDMKPFSYLKNGELVGSSIDQTKHIFTSVPVDVTLQLYSDYSLLFKALKKDEIQGFFMASQNVERDRYAVYSKPLILSKWTWFTRTQDHYNLESDEFQNSRRVAALNKSNIFRWLTRNGFQVQGNIASQLPTVLLNKQVDAVLSDEHVFLQTCKDQGIHLKNFKKITHEVNSYGMYISKKYLMDNPNFMAQLNKLIPDI